MAELRSPKILEAELFHRELQGQSRALVVTARSEEGDPVDCIVKLSSRLKFPPTEHLREWLACALGAVLGIRVPTPYEVVITEDFANAIDDVEVRRDSLKSVGTIFGCSIFDAATQFTASDRLRSDLVASAAELLAFDVFIHNVDRRQQNHNVLVRRDEFVAFDHGDAFAFIFPVILAPDPAEDPCEGLVQQHVLRQSLRGIALPLEGFYAAVSGVSDEVFQQIRRLTPAGWQTGPAAGKLEEIIRVLRGRRDAVKRWLPMVEQLVCK